MTLSRPLRSTSRRRRTKAGRPLRLALLHLPRRTCSSTAQTCPALTRPRSRRSPRPLSASALLPPHPLLPGRLWARVPNSRPAAVAASLSGCGTLSRQSRAPMAAQLQHRTKTTPRRASRASTSWTHATPPLPHLLLQRRASQRRNRCARPPRPSRRCRVDRACEPRASTVRAARRRARSARSRAV